MPLTKVRRGGTDTGITDASDATAITIDSSENVGIGTATPVSGTKLTINDSAFGGLQFQSGGSDCGYIGVNTNTLFVGGGTQVAFHTGHAQATDGTERMKIDSNGHLILKKNLALDTTTSEGIDFGAAGSSANTLDDYEEGTWTPAINQGGSTLGIIANSAIYTKVGRFVHIQVYATSLASTTSSGFRISGLPFTNLSYGQTVGSIMYQNIDIPGSRTQMVAYAPSSSDIIRLYGVGDNTSWQEITGTNTGTSFNMIINLQYTTS